MSKIEQYKKDLPPLRAEIDQVSKQCDALYNVIKAQFDFIRYQQIIAFAESMPAATDEEVLARKKAIDDRFFSMNVKINVTPDYIERRKRLDDLRKKFRDLNDERKSKETQIEKAEKAARTRERNKVNIRHPPT